jgi:chromosome segregation ATPase
MTTTIPEIRARWKAVNWQKRYGRIDIDAKSTLMDSAPTDIAFLLGELAEAQRDRRELIDRLADRTAQFDSAQAGEIRAEREVARLEASIEATDTLVAGYLDKFQALGDVTVAGILGEVLTCLRGEV